MRNKYRAWDKFERRMIVDEQDFIPLIVTNKGVVRLSPKHKESLYERVDNNRFKIMQSTGLKDKNGADIYEGDILLSTASENQEDWKKWQVYFEDGRFLIDYKQIPKDKRKRKNLEIEDLCEDNIWLYGLKVIGNIYEKPELMEVE